MRAKRRNISCDAIDCKHLDYLAGEYVCLKRQRKTNGRVCIRCKFALQKVREDSIRAGLCDG